MILIIKSVCCISACGLCTFLIVNYCKKAFLECGEWGHSRNGACVVLENLFRASLPSAVPYTSASGWYAAGSVCPLQLPWPALSVGLHTVLPSEPLDVQVFGIAVGASQEGKRKMSLEHRRIQYLRFKLSWSNFTFAPIQEKCKGYNQFLDLSRVNI